MNIVHPDYYESNIRLLEKYHPDIWVVLKEHAYQLPGEIILMPDGKYNLKTRGNDGQIIFFHNTDHLEEEKKKYLNAIPPDAKGFVCVTGLGLGYNAVELIKNRSNLRHVAVFEPNRDTFLTALKYVDLSKLLSDPRVILCIDKDPDLDSLLGPTIVSLRLENIHTVSHQPSFDYDKKTYQELFDKIFTFLSFQNVNGGTLLVLGETFLENRLRHLESIQHDFLLESLQGAFKGIPAFIVAGGPSLNKNIHQLSRVKDKAIIIAVDTVLPALLSHGVTPTFLTSIDMTEFSYEKIANQAPDIDELYLICTSWVNAKVPKNYPANGNFWVFSNNHIEKWLNSLLGGNLQIGGAATVAHLNFLSAIIMGCSPIVFMGQDLAYTPEKCHVDGAVITVRHELNDPEYLKKDEVVFVDGFYGGKVQTNRSFYGMKNYFERIIVDNPGNYLNATEGGVMLKGAESVTLESVIEKYCLAEHNISNSIKHYINDSSNKINCERMTEDFNRIIGKIESLQKNIKKSDQLANSTRKKILSIKKGMSKINSINDFSKSIQQNLGKIDSLHHKIDSENEVWQLLIEVTMSGLRESERLKQEIESLSGQPGKFYSYVLKSLERCDQINKVRTCVLSEFKERLLKIIRFHENENNYFKNMENKEDIKTDLLQLVRMYFESGNFHLAYINIQNNLKLLSENAEINFYLGSISLQWVEFEKAEKYYQIARQLDPAFTERIETYRKSLGDKYYHYSMIEGEFDRKTRTIMLVKGLQYCTDHDLIIKELNARFLEDFEKLKLEISGHSFDIVDPIIEEWSGIIEKNKHFEVCLEKDKIAEFYLYVGKRFVIEKNYDEAVRCIERSLHYKPNDPQFYINISELYFVQNKFDAGIEFLKKAVHIDRNYAQYWENIGNNLIEQGNHDGAIAAFEQYFISWPEKNYLLKKIGDCYMAMGQEDAANEAYRQCEIKQKR